ncbi:MAG: UPF0175 family protein [Verrucomicrobia bacterium]|nr:UPF0175 family protein [Verrucomicrobiota bacterium]MCH8514093.1 UPF0175 family protein [Kiritimatiellia bacterium]
MTLTLDIPDDLVQSLGENQEECEQLAREAIAIQLYRLGKISLRTMGRLAGVGDDIWSADSLRVKYGIATNIESVDSDQEAIRLLRKQA